MLSLLREDYFQKVCEGKEPSVSDNLNLDVIGVIKMSMQSVTRLVCIGSKSEDLHGAHRTRWRTPSAVSQLRFCRTFLVSGGFNTRESESEGKEERMTEILSNEKRADCVCQSGNRKMIKKVHFRAAV